MVSEYGMSSVIGAIDYVGEARANPFGIGPARSGFADASPDTAEQSEREVHRFLSDCHRRAREILNENRPILEEMAADLLEREKLDGEEMEGFLSRVTKADELAEPPTGELQRIGGA
jgi:cell division protease FtsH